MHIKILSLNFKILVRAFVEEVTLIQIKNRELSSFKILGGNWCGIFLKIFEICKFGFLRAKIGKCYTYKKVATLHFILGYQIAEY